MIRMRSVLLGLLLSAASLAGAQLTTGTGMPNVQYMPHLLLNPKVQKELKVSPQLASKVQGILVEEGMKMMGTLNSQGQRSPSAQQQMADQAVRAYNRMETRTVALLNASQKARLRQLSLQTLGPMALLQDKVGKEVALTASQRAHLQEVVAKENRLVFTGMSSPPGKPNDINAMRRRTAEVAKRQKAARDATEAALVKILTPKQRAKWNAMLGKRMDLGAMGMGGMFGG